MHFIHFPESAKFSDYFDSFVSKEKFTLEVDDLRKRFLL